MSAIDELLELVKGQENLERLAELIRDEFAKQRAVNEALLNTLPMLSWPIGLSPIKLEAALLDALK